MLRGRACPWGSEVALLRRAGGWIVASVALSVMLFAWAAEPPELRLAAGYPGDGAVLAAAPVAVRVEFEGLLNPAETHLSLSRRTGGALLSKVPAELDGQALTVPVEPGGPGDYVLAYHVRLVDGRQLTGVSRFSVTGGGPVSDSPAVAGPPAAPDAHAHGSDDPFSRGLLVLDLILIIGAVAVLLRPARLRGRGRP